MATLTIKRNSSINLALSRFNIYLNDKIIGKIGNGKSLELQVPDGDYELKIGLSPKSNCSNILPVSLKNNEMRCFEVGYPKGAFTNQVLNMSFLLLMILPAMLTFMMPHRPQGSGLVSGIIAIIGAIGFLWTLKRQKNMKQRSGVHLVETTPVSSND